jgi:hypothetical protein
VGLNGDSHQGPHRRGALEEGVEWRGPVDRSSRGGPMEEVRWRGSPGGLREDVLWMSPLEGAPGGGPA